MFLILYNPISRNGRNTKVVSKAIKRVSRDKDEKVYSKNLLEITNVEHFLQTLEPNTKAVIVGGDGTLHRIANALKNHDNLPPIYLFKAGTGNDFRRSIKKRGQLILINEYLNNIPSVFYTNQAGLEEEKKFLNCAGFGYDGLVCYNLDQARTAKSHSNFFKITIGSLNQYRPTDLKVVVDGVEHNFKKAWLITAMNGQYFGGGMKGAPKANRKDPDTQILVVSNITKNKLLLLFPSIYLGFHPIFKKHVTILKGREIIAEIDGKAYLQIDGESGPAINKIRVVKWK